MSNIFIVNAGTQYGASEGKLNNHFTQIAKELFESNGHQVQVTRVEDAYDAEAEVQKILWADTIIYQMPAWWMGAPWTLKKYIDEVFSDGYGQIFDNDGRTRSDASRKYGS
jgi:modulator of drug activity B